MSDNASRLARAKKLISPDDLAPLGPGPRAGRLSVGEIDERLADILRGVPAGTAALVRSLVLLWHDHLDASHAISQDIGSADGSFLHGVMHRREPDYGNGKYWFRRAGDHPILTDLAERAQEIVTESFTGDALAEQIEGDVRDPFAFVDACEDAARLPDDDPVVIALQRVQHAEADLLLERFLA